MRYSILEITPPALEPLDTEEAKKHLRVDIDDDDEEIDRFVKAARQWYEGAADLALLEQTLEARFDGFPGERGECRRGAAWDGVDRNAIFVPRAPMRSVASIKYLSTDGVLTTLSPSSYEADTASRPARIVPAYGTAWPSTREMPGCVRVQFVAGFATAAADVPEPIRQLIRLLVDHQYDQHSPIVTGTIVNELPFAIRDLFWNTRNLIAA